MKEVWVTYTTKYGGGHQLDREPNSYRNVAIFFEEIDALRYANANGAKAIKVSDGSTLEGAINADMRLGGMAPA